MGSWYLVIALGVKVAVCAVRVKQHFQVILKDEDDDLIDLYRRLDLSYEIIQTPLRVIDNDKKPKLKKQGTVTFPKNHPEYNPLEDEELDYDPFEESEKVGKDNLVLGAYALHPDGADGGPAVDMSVESSDAQLVKRRISRMDAIGEDPEEYSLETIPETEM